MVQKVVEPFAVVVVVPWGGRPVACVDGTVAHEGGGMGGHCRLRGLEASCKALDSTLE